MIKVKLTTSSLNWDFLRQTPKNSGVFDNCQFFVNEYIDECDYWVVFEGLKNEESTKCAPENTILITGEPPSVKKYNPEFVKQFGTVITCHRKMKHPNKFYSQQSLPWMIGARYLANKKQWSQNFTKSFDELTQMKTLKKTKLLSVVSSNNASTKGHRERLTFVKLLKEHFGDQIDVFGRELKDFEDKWDVIAPYKYHIAIENSQNEDYWTEKLSDCFLAKTYPIYYGCLNISDYFSKNTYTEIDLKEPKRAIALIEKIIKQNQYEKSLKELKTAKNLVLNKYNLFASIANYVNQQKSKTTDIKQLISLQPERIVNYGFVSKIKILIGSLKNKF